MISLWIAHDLEHRKWRHHKDECNVRHQQKQSSAEDDPTKIDGDDSSPRQDFTSRNPGVCAPSGLRESANRSQEGAKHGILKDPSRRKCLSLAVLSHSTLANYSVDPAYQAAVLARRAEFSTQFLPVAHDSVSNSV